jgi:hypothetical protein
MKYENDLTYQRDLIIEKEIIDFTSKSQKFCDECDIINHEQNNTGKPVILHESNCDETYIGWCCHHLKKIEF